MGKRRKSQGVRLEIRLGIAVIIIVLTVLNIASYYTLYRIGNSIEDNIREKLAEASLLAAGHMNEKAEGYIDKDLKSRILFDYALENLDIFPLEFDRVLEISRNGRADSIMLAFDSVLDHRDISPILYNNPVYLFNSEHQRYVLLFPTERTGSKYIIGVSRKADMIGAINNAKIVLQIFSIIVGIVIILVVTRLIKNVIRPFGVLAEEIRKANPGEGIESDDINEVIRTYEGMIEELREKENELRKLNEIVTRKADHLEIYNNHILRSIDTGIVTLDEDNKISTVNPAAARLLNIDQYNVIGESYTGAFSLIPDISDGLGESLTARTPIQYRETTLGDGDCKKVLLYSVANLTDGEGGKIGLVLIINDQTRFMEMQRELEHNRRLAIIGEMSGGLAHQLRNSIMAIVGFAKLIGKKTGEENPLYDTSENLVTEARQAELLVSRFLDYARPLNLASERFIIAELMEEIVGASRSRFPHVDIELENCDYTAEITADHLLLKQAFGNIVDNACQAYGDLPGKVSIEMECNDDSLIVHIRDDAGGIPEEIRDQIFTPFFSGNPSGSGLGLPLAEKIISLHGGKINFDSELKCGTVFRVEIPSKTTIAEESLNIASN